MRKSWRPWVSAMATNAATQRPCRQSTAAAIGTQLPSGPPIVIACNFKKARVSYRRSNSPLVERIRAQKTKRAGTAFASMHSWLTEPSQPPGLLPAGPPTSFGRVERWTRLVRQLGGLAKVDSGSDYAASFSCLLSIA
jgi:hypothetical protein